jgi:hypothetical protein
MQNTRDLRAFLTEQMIGIANGSIEPDKAKAISNISQQIYNTLNIEIKLALAKEKLGDREIEPINFNG